MHATMIETPEAIARDKAVAARRRLVSLHAHREADAQAEKDAVAETLLLETMGKVDAQERAIFRLNQIVSRVRAGRLIPAIALRQIEGYAAAVSVEVYDMACDAVTENAEEGMLDVAPSVLARATVTPVQKKAQADAETRRARMREFRYAGRMSDRGVGAVLLSEHHRSGKLAAPTRYAVGGMWVAVEGPALPGEEWPVRVYERNEVRNQRAVWAVGTDGVAQDSGKRVQSVPAYSPLVAVAATRRQAAQDMRDGEAQRKAYQANGWAH